MIFGVADYRRNADLAWWKRTEAEADFQVCAVPLGGGNGRRRMIVDDMHARGGRTAMHTIELKQWTRRGGNGVFINHEASRTSNDCYVCEIPPAQKLAPQRQLFEEMILVFDGRGSTTVWNDAAQRVSFEW